LLQSAGTPVAVAAAEEEVLAAAAGGIHVVM